MVDGRDAGVDDYDGPDYSTFTDDFAFQQPKPVYYWYEMTYNPITEQWDGDYVPMVTRNGRMIRLDR